MTKTDTTDFGFETVSRHEKTRRVGEVFHSVASHYDLMNDLMSFGIHRLWKRFTVLHAGVRSGQQVLDVAGGTGDMAFLFHQRVGENGNVFVTDINDTMLKHGRNKLIDRGVIRGMHFVQANAEHLPFPDNSFDCMSIAFGLRNVTDKQAAIRSMYEKTKYGGCLIILEFSQLMLPWLQKCYDTWSLKVIPWLGKTIADDEASYRYLVESIRMHPDQETLKGILEDNGFAKVDYHNLTGGIVAVHKAYKL